MRFKGTIILFGFALLIGAVYLFYLVPHSREQKLREELESRFFRVDAGQVEFLRIQNAQGTFSLSKEGTVWNITAPRTLPSDEKTLQRLFDLIGGGKIEKVITDDVKRAPEFGLDKPEAVIALGFGGKLDEIALGGLNPTKTGIYAFARGIQAIFLVDKEIAEISRIGLYELRSKALFHFDPGAITKISIHRKKGDIELEEEKGRWTMVRPFSGRASDEGVKEFLLNILNQRADEIYDDRVPQAKDYSDSIKINLYSEASGAPGEIEVYYWGTGANEGAVAYQKGMKYSGRLSRDFWNSLDRDASTFRYRNLFAFEEPDVWKIKVRKGSSEYELVRRGKDWNMGTMPVERKKVLEFIWFLKAWQAERLLAPSQRFTNERPSVEIALSDSAGKSIGVVRVLGKREGEVLGYSSRGGSSELFSAITDNLKEPCAVSSMDVKTIPGREEFTR